MLGLWYCHVRDCIYVLKTTPNGHLLREITPNLRYKARRKKKQKKEKEKKPPSQIKYSCKIINTMKSAEFSKQAKMEHAKLTWRKLGGKIDSVQYEVVCLSLVTVIQKLKLEN